MSYSYKIGFRAIERGAFVEIDFGSRLAQVIRQTVKYRQPGYDVLPLPSVSNPAQGVYSQFIPDTFAKPADMNKWVRSDDGRLWIKKTKETEDHEDAAPADAG
jgi:hypothetical protein